MAIRVTEGNAVWDDRSQAWRSVFEAWLDNKDGRPAVQLGDYIVGLDIGGSLTVVDTTRASDPPARRRAMEFD